MNSKNLAIFLSFAFFSVGALASENHGNELKDLRGGAELAASLYRGAEAVAIEAERKAGGVNVNIFSRNGASIKADAYDCKTNNRSEALTCNGQTSGSPNSAFKQMLEAADSLAHGFEEGGGKPESIFYFKVYKRPTGSIWARAKFKDAQGAVKNAVFSCHLHGKHFDCHYNSGNAAGPDEPLQK